MIKKVKHHLKKVKHKHIFGILIIALVVVGFISYKWKVNKVIGADGNEDLVFYNNLSNNQTGPGFNYFPAYYYPNVQSLDINDSGEIIVGGDFNRLNNNTRNSLVKLNSSGTEVASFATNINSVFGSNQIDVTFVKVLLADGDILVGGNFTTPQKRIVRLNNNGTLDTDTPFNTNIGTGFNDYVQYIKILSDGDILIGGNFTTFKGTTRNRIVRLNNDGLLDSTTGFNTNTSGSNGSNGIVYSINYLPDGDILVGGNFTQFNGVTRKRIVRLNNNGILDTDTPFNTNTNVGANGGFNEKVSTIKVNNNDIFVGGSFSIFNGIQRDCLVLLDNNGLENTTFYNNFGGFSNESTNGGVENIAIQNNKIIIVGDITGINTPPLWPERHGLVRLNYNGTEDVAFYTTFANGQVETGNGCEHSGFCLNSHAQDIVVQPDGKLLIGGKYTYKNNQQRGALVRLESSNTIPEVTITAEPTSISETQTNVPLTYTLHLSSPLAQPITVNLNYNGTATPPPSVNKDYTPALQTSITIPAGSLSVSIPIFGTVDDDVYELDETIKATITNITPAGVATGINNSATINITSNEEVPVINIVPQPISQAIEQTPTSINFSLEPTVRSYEDISVNFKLGGTASREIDYKGVNGALPETLTGTIPAYNSFKTTSEFTLYDDNLIEGQEIISTDNINITSGNATAGSPGIFTIYDNETNDPPSVSLKFYPSLYTPNTYTMKWFISGNATSCTKSSSPPNSAWDGIIPPADGAQTISGVIINTTFSINCTGPDGSDTDSVSIIVDKIPVNLSSNTQWKRGVLGVEGLQVDVASDFENGLLINNSNIASDKVISSVTSSNGVVADWVYLNNSGQYLDPWVRINPLSLVRLNTDNLNDNIILQNNSVIYKTNEIITESNKEQYKFIHENGTGNLFFGLGSGLLSISTSNNTGVGYNALNSLQSGNTNITAFGAYAGKMITGNNHTVLGYNAHKENHGALNDISIGSESGNCTLCNQGNNISIGANSGPINADLTHTVSIGHDAHANVNHSMMFGNSSVLGWGFGTSPGSGQAIKVGFPGGENGNGAFLTSGGTWTSTSDKSLKHDIVDLSYGLNEIMKLRPVDFKWNHNNQKDFGFVAQEVKKIIPEIVSGIEGDMGISYSKISPILTKALQEQQIIIDNYKERIKLLKNRIEILENK